MLKLLINMSIFLSVILPISLLIYLLIKQKISIKYFLLGLLFSSVIILLVQPISIIAIDFLHEYALVYSILLGGLMGILEECVRFLSLLALKGKQKLNELLSMAFGQVFFYSVLYYGFFSAMSDLTTYNAIQDGSIYELLEKEVAISIVEKFNNLNIFVYGLQPLWIYATIISFVLGFILIYYGIHHNDRKQITIMILFHGLNGALYYALALLNEPLAIIIYIIAIGLFALYTKPFYKALRQENI